MCDSIANGGRRGVLAGDIIQPFANLVVSNSVTTTNVIATTYFGDGGLLSNITTGLVQPLANLVVSNTVTTNNVSVGNTLTVSGAMTSNTANTTFFYDTFTIPYINTQVLNVASMIGITNVTTLNVQSLFANSATIYGANTLNVLGISNLNSLVTPTANVETLNVIAISNLANLTVSNTVTTTNIVAAGFTSNSTNTVFNFDTLTIPFVNSTTLNVSSTSNLLSVSAANVIIGSGVTTVQANLHIEKGSIFIGNSAVIGATTNTNSVTQGTLVFDNTANTSIIPNKILLFSNTASPGLCGFGVNSSGGGQLYYHARSTHIFYLGNPNTNEVMRINSGSAVGIGTGTVNAKLHVGTSNQNNVQVRIDASNVALTTSGGGRIGIDTLTPSANLHVVGNIYASNALQTTNVSAATVSTTNPIPFRNRIINGGMSIWQRNTASITTTPGIYTTADRWCGALGTSGLLLSQWPGPTEAPQFQYSLQVTTSNVSTGVPLVEQHIENLNIPDFLNGTAVSVSFYAGQPYGTLMPLTVGLYYGTVVNNFGVQTLAVAATQNTPTLTASNVYYSLSFTLTSSLGATNGLSLRFTTGGASAVGSTILLTGVQVEKGLLATPFEVRPYATELALCQRYYYQLTSPTAAVQGTSTVYSIFGTATGITTTAFWVPIQFPVPMRNPYYSFSNSAVTNFQLLPTGTTTITSVGLQTDSFTPVSATLNFVGTNIVAGSSYIFRTNGLTGSNVAFFGFSCEL